MHLAELKSNMKKFNFQDLILLGAFFLIIIISSCGAKTPEVTDSKNVDIEVPVKKVTKSFF